jgi:hypothetical protein
VSWNGNSLSRLSWIRGIGQALLRRRELFPQNSGPDGTKVSRDARHIFIFGVWGRSSTTALQRILNSSGEVCIWGEPGGGAIDDLLGLISHLKQKNLAPEARARKRILADAFHRGDHSVNYCMAFPELDPVINDLVSAFMHMFTPINEVERFGFKEIRVRSATTLQTLRDLFPRSQFLFVFRNPLSQWPSVRKMSWEQTRTLNAFLAEYQRLAAIYLDFGGIFVESASLYDKSCVRKLLDKTEFTSFDESLVGDGVYAMKNKQPLTDDETNQIKASSAWQLYELMKQVEAKSG